MRRQRPDVNLPMKTNRKTNSTPSVISTPTALAPPGGVTIGLYLGDRSDYGSFGYHGRWLVCEGESGGGPPHSKTLRAHEGLGNRASVLECGGPPPLWVGAPPITATVKGSMALFSILAQFFHPSLRSSNSSAPASVIGCWAFDVGCWMF